MGQLFKAYLSEIAAAHETGSATEHTYRPALKNLLEAFSAGTTAINEPKRISCGAPDYIVVRGEIPLGFIEAKDIGVSLEETENSEQLKRYRDSLANLVLTDYLEFRWYIGGEMRLCARVANIQSGKLRADAAGIERLKELLDRFFSENIPVISTPGELAGRMAALARLIRDIISRTLAEEGERGSLHDQLDAFRKILMHDLTAAQFADMYAQTICYGLFAARCNGAEPHFDRKNATHDLPKTNPFLRRMFGHIAGPELDERIVWAVDSLAELLNRADIAAVLKDFGRATLQQDPVVHFYETFLAAYDPQMRESRGVYYTPEPVVSYIVRSVDEILKSDFKLPKGLADSSRISGKGKENSGMHRVQILDPAAGTGTFLHQVAAHIHETMSGNKGLWAGYVSEDLLPRLYGFELLMAPYAVAHMKLGLLLSGTGYDFKSEERLRVYLTNTLEEAHEHTGLPLFTQWLAEEANSASSIKKDAPIMVVLGNPPYSGHSANTGEWIKRLLNGFDTLTKRDTENYFMADGKPLGERNPKWLNDDYVKFIRFAQWRIEQTGYGVLAFVTNHGYLDNPTFRGMRQSLMKTFDDIYILDLHGNSKKKEKAADGGKDENVFDIQQGVAIGIFVKRAGKHDKDAQVRHAGLSGLREGKYEILSETDCVSTKWKTLKPQSPHYLFIPQDNRLKAEYEQGWKINEIMPVNSVGIVTARDALTIHLDRAEAWHVVNDFANLPPETAREKYGLGDDARDWKVALAQADLKAPPLSEDKLVPILYRPFDVRHTYYTGNSRGFHCMPRGEVMRHMLAGKNLAIIARRQMIGELMSYFYASNSLISDGVIRSDNKGGESLFPLYLYQTADTADLFEQADSGERRPNLSPEFIKEFAERLKLSFIQDGKGDLKTTFGPEDIFHYGYTVFYSPEYRRRYAQFLKMDFPRLPLTTDIKLFRKLCAIGEELVSLHLMENLPAPKARYPETGDNLVENVRYTEPSGKTPGRVYINAKQYFENVPPQVWNYQIGGYQVCNKWLKDRKSRKLSYDDLTRYMSITAALSQTITLQSEIDQSINAWPMG
ncbi:MAG: type ISP restriction/modification enzyme [Elusimicrobiales bacterium]